jgi:hypothetical protein
LTAHLPSSMKKGQENRGGFASIEDRFWAKVERTDTCWLWTASTDGRGRYGSFGVHGRLVRAHRFAYELLVGPIPDGLVLDHLCSVTRCVNPAHLEPVTQAENNRRSRNANRVACPHGHAYTPENTERSSAGARICRTCRIEQARRRQREYRARKRAA